MELDFLVILPLKSSNLPYFVKLNIDLILSDRAKSTRSNPNYLFGKESVYNFVELCPFKVTFRGVRL